METTTTPIIEKVRLELKDVTIKLDIFNQLADTYIDYMHCKLASNEVAIQGCVAKADKAENSDFVPIKITDGTGRYDFKQYCQKMNWDYFATAIELDEAYKAEMQS